jgi:hypothetical protein
VLLRGFSNKISPPSSPPTAPIVNFDALPDITIDPVSTSVDPSNNKLDSALAVLAVPREVSILLSAEFVIVLNPVPEVPLDPDVPEEPELPLVPELPEVPLVPEEPELPLVPELPEVPLVPEEPELPLVPDVPLVPEEPTDANHVVPLYL